MINKSEELPWPLRSRIQTRRQVTFNADLRESISALRLMVKSGQTASRIAVSISIMNRQRFSSEPPYLSLRRFVFGLRN